MNWMSSTNSLVIHWSDIPLARLRPRRVEHGADACGELSSIQRRQVDTEPPLQGVDHFGGGVEIDVKRVAVVVVDAEVAAAQVVACVVGDDADVEAP
jgi:hypothetical protein